MWVRVYVRNHWVTALQENKKITGDCGAAAERIPVPQATLAPASVLNKNTLARYLTVASLVMIAAGLVLSNHVSGHVFDWPGAAVIAGAVLSVAAAHIALTATSDLRTAPHVFRRPKARELRTASSNLKTRSGC